MQSSSHGGRTIRFKPLSLKGLLLLVRGVLSSHCDWVVFTVLLAGTGCDKTWLALREEPFPLPS